MIGPSVISDQVKQIHLQLLIVCAAVGVLTAESPTAYALLQPGAGWTAPDLFVAEAAGMGVIVFLVGYFLRSAHLAPLVPWLVGLLIGGATTLLGTTTGGCVNPARQFGPAVVSGLLSSMWVYLPAPVVGALVTALTLDRVNKHRT
ncbi:aquaporin [Streptomyces carpinensis]|uniref:Aquaporin n=1 Tax=Streptomyces carpinensis TaxID=66369 RepID=A0ABV1WF59_9ACTN|nr:aquaporin [Streptomyces carpinensis]